MRRQAWVLVAAILVGLSVPAPASADIADGWDYYDLASPVPTAIPVSGQFVGDASIDVLMYSPGPTPDLLYDFGLRNAARTYLAPIGGTYTPLVGDFGGDDYDDIIWYAPGPAPDSLWISDGRGGFRSKPLSIGGNYGVQVLHDYRDYGGKDDLLFLGAGAVPDYLWHFTDRSGDLQYVGPGTYLSRLLKVNGNYRLVIGDWTGDGLDDVVLYQPGTAFDYRWDSNAAGEFRQTNVTVNGNYVPSTVYQKDRDGIFWLGVGAQAEAYWTSNGAGFTSRAVPDIATGPSRATPFGLGSAVVLDQTGEDLIFEGTATGGRYVPLTSPAYDRTTQVPSVGDYDGDGLLDVIWSGPPSPEIWYTDPSDDGWARAGAAPSRAPGRADEHAVANRPRLGPPAGPARSGPEGRAT